MARIRLLAVIAIMVLLAASQPTAFAASAPRLPTSAADWATFSATERAEAMAYVRHQLDDALAAGVVPNQVSSGLADASMASLEYVATISVTYLCQIQWIDVGSGMWVRGGGWTDASYPIYTIYAGRQGLKGQFLRDGQLLANWWQQAWNNVSHAESWTGYNFKFFFEHPSYFVKGWHGAQQTSGGTWLLGPDRYCSVQITL